ncbi:MAG: AraC family transcriptional regulator [SAR324 cluster bacterium]|nr:AraC family transcriptional regulator [SAR324 cluster bacterium]
MGDLEETLGLTHAQLMEPDRRIPFISHYAMINKGIELTEPAIGLKIGNEITPERMGMVGHILQNCNHLEEACHQIIRYFKLFFEMVDWKVEKRRKSIAFIYSVKNPKFYMRYGAEIMLSAALTLMRSLTSTDFIPDEIRFRFEKPEYYSDYRKIFRTQIKFDQNEDAILLSQNQFKLPIPGGQSFIKDILLKHADDLLDKAGDSETIKKQVQKLVYTELANGEVDIVLISEKLQISRWTLTRKLKDEGTTFKQLLQDSREKLAKVYLKKQAESVTEIAFLLGYSEASAFQRAFKKWVGETPLEYRLNHSTV